MDIADDLKKLLLDAVQETGINLGASLQEATKYAAERAQHLKTLVGQPGFELAVRAERDAVALKVGISIVGQAEATDHRIAGIIQGVLTIAAKVLAAAA